MSQEYDDAIENVSSKEQIAATAVELDDVRLVDISDQAIAVSQPKPAIFSFSASASISTRT